MLDSYTNQITTFEKNIGNDEYNKIVYLESVNIKVRKEKKVQKVRNKLGVEVISNTTIFTKTLINIDDKIDSELVINVMSMTDLDGEVIGYEVML